MGDSFKDSRSTAIVSAQASLPALSPIQELQMQIIRTGDLDKLRELRDLEKEWRADQAKQAFVEAMAAFKQEPAIVRIARDKVNPQFKSTYSSLGNEVAIITPLLSKYGLSVEWEIDQSSGFKVTCIITHVQGHSKPTTIVLPLDTSGTKNGCQQIKSTITYGRIISLECACGIATVEGNLDDDANSASQKVMDEDTLQEWIEVIRSSSDEEDLKRGYFDAKAAAEKIGDRQALNRFATEKNNRYKAILQKGGAR